MITTNAKAASAQDQVLASISGGGSQGSLRIFSGTVPANLTVTPTGTQLVSIPVGTTALNAFAATNTGTLVASGNSLPWTGTATNTGTASFFRFYTAAGVAVLQGSVSVTGGGGELQLSTLTVTAGNVIAVSAFTSTISGVT